jgi:MYXO-CTERM domain-containing protein
MLRPLSTVALTSLALASSASAGLWVVGHGDDSHFYSVADAVGSVVVSNGDTIRVASGGYIGDFDTGDKVLSFEPGNSPGIVDVYGSMYVRPNSTVNFEIGGFNSGLLAGNPDFDQFIVTGNVNYQGTLAVRLTNSFSPSLGDSWALIQAGGTISFSGITSLPALSGGLSWDVQVVGGSSEFGASGSSLVVSVVPAPGAAALIGLAGLATTRRRRA